MARRAGWRARRDDPRTIVGWALRDEGSRWLPLSLAFVLMMVAGGLAVGWSAWAILLVPAIALHVRRGAAIPEGLDALGTVPPPGPAFRVHLQIREAGPPGSNLLLGTDDGIVTFVDGWLHFTGLRTDFAIRGGDVVHASQEARGDLLALREVGAIRLVVGNDPEERTLFRAALDAWRLASPEGESILPPGAIHPSGVVRAWRDAATTTAAALVGALAFVRWTGFGGVFALLPTSSGVYRRLSRARVLRREALVNERRAALGP